MMQSQTRQKTIFRNKEQFKMRRKAYWAACVVAFALSLYFTIEICGEYLSRQVVTSHELEDAYNPAPAITVCLSKDLQQPFNKPIIWNEQSNQTVRFFNKRCHETGAIFRNPSSWRAYFEMAVYTLLPVEIFLSKNQTNEGPLSDSYFGTFYNRLQEQKPNATIYHIVTFESLRLNRGALESVGKCKDYEKVKTLVQKSQLGCKRQCLERAVEKNGSAIGCRSVCRLPDCFRETFKLRSDVFSGTTRTSKYLFMPHRPSVLLTESLKISLQVLFIYVTGLWSIFYGFSVIKIANQLLRRLFGFGRRSLLGNAKNKKRKKIIKYIVKLACFGGFCCQSFRIAETYWCYEVITETRVGVPRDFLELPSLHMCQHYYLFLKERCYNEDLVKQTNFTQLNDCTMNLTDHLMALQISAPNMDKISINKSDNYKPFVTDYYLADYTMSFLINGTVRRSLIKCFAVNAPRERGKTNIKKAKDIYEVKFKMDSDKKMTMKYFMAANLNDFPDLTLEKNMFNQATRIGMEDYDETAMRLNSMHTSVSSLPPPFKTDCHHYPSQAGFKNKLDCIHSCLRHRFGSLLKDKKTNLVWQTPFLNNVTNDLELSWPKISLALMQANRKIEKTCHETCKSKDCRIETFEVTSLDHISSNQPGRFISLGYPAKETILIYLPSVPLDAFAIYLTSVLGFWIGVSILPLTKRIIRKLKRFYKKDVQRRFLNILFNLSKFVIFLLFLWNNFALVTQYLKYDVVTQSAVSFLSHVKMPTIGFIQDLNYGDFKKAAMLTNKEHFLNLFSKAEYRNNATRKFEVFSTEEFFENALKTLSVEFSQRDGTVHFRMDLNGDDFKDIQTSNQPGTVLKLQLQANFSYKLFLFQSFDDFDFEAKFSELKNNSQTRILVTRVTQNRLPSPYSSKCQHYKTSSLKCRENGINKMLYSKFGRFNFNQDVPLATQNVTFLDEANSMNEKVLFDCSIKCYPPDCITRQWYLQNDNYSDRNDSYNVHIEFLPFESRATLVPLLNTTSLVLYLSTVISIWYGFSVLSFAKLGRLTCST